MREEAGSLLVSDALFVTRPIEYVLDREHTDQGESFVGAGQVNGGEEHFRQLRFQRNFSHHPAKLRQQPFLIKTAQGVELL